MEATCRPDPNPRSLSTRKRPNIRQRVRTGESEWGGGVGLFPTAALHAGYAKECGRRKTATRNPEANKGPHTGKENWQPQKQPRLHTGNQSLGVTTNAKAKMAGVLRDAITTAA